MRTFSEGKNVEFHYMNARINELNLEDRVSEDPTPESRRSRCCEPPPPGGLLSSGYVQSSSFSSESALSSAADCRRRSTSPAADDDCPAWQSAEESGLARCEVRGEAVAGSSSSSSSSSSSRVRSEFNSESSTATANIDRKSRFKIKYCNAVKIWLRSAIKNWSRISYVFFFVN